jgi:ferric iron reductase protein FhuF
MGKILRNKELASIIPELAIRSQVVNELMWMNLAYLIGGWKYRVVPSLRGHIAGERASARIHPFVVKLAFIQYQNCLLCRRTNKQP